MYFDTDDNDLSYKKLNIHNYVPLWIWCVTLCWHCIRCYN